MDKFNYNKVLYENGICDLNNIEEFRKISKNFKEVEELLKKKTSCLDELRKLIILSYKFNKKDIRPIDRANFIRGIAYSRHYIDEDDINNFISQINQFNLFFENANISVFESLEIEEDITVYSIKNILDYQNRIPSYDEYEELKKNNKKENEIRNKSTLIDTINKEDTDTDDEDEDIDDDIDEDIDDDIDENYLDKYRKLEPDEIIYYLKDNFEEYIKLIIQNKEIVDEKEKKYVIEGMNCWFNQIFHELESLYKISIIERKMQDKTLFKSL